MSPSLPVGLYDYQKRWVADGSRFKIGMWSRQAGKSFSTSLEAVLDCFARRARWVFLSAGERQSKELMSTAQTHARAVHEAADILSDSYRGESGDVYKQLEIRFRNGSRIVGLPANPDTARGHSAHVLLDEFAFHKDSRAIWRALFPTATRGYKIRIISTPQGKQNKFYELWSGENGYAKHRTTIFDAVGEGLELLDERGDPTTPDALRAALADDDAWRQEYLCEFLDEATAFLTYETIGECESASAGMDDPPEGGPVYVGVDIGRKRDLTVLWALELVGDVLWTRRVLEMERATFSAQRAAIEGFLRDARPVRVCMDSTGLGMQLAEEMRDAFGGRVEPVTFTLAVKEDLATTLRRRFEDRTIRIPVDRKVREDLHSVKRAVTSSGNVRFSAERSEDGHADRFWALALAAHAAASLGEIAYGGMDPGPRDAGPVSPDERPDGEPEETERMFGIGKRVERLCR